MSSISSETAPSQTQLRAELEKMVMGDLLGPAGGESEELTERSVRDRYLVGVLAPSRGQEAEGQPGGRPNDSQAAAGLPGASGEEDDEDESAPLVPDELAEGGSDSREDGTTDKDAPVATGFLPSSMGMTPPENGTCLKTALLVGEKPYHRWVDFSVTTFTSTFVSNRESS